LVSDLFEREGLFRPRGAAVVWHGTVFVSLRLEAWLKTLIPKVADKGSAQVHLVGNPVVVLGTFLSDAAISGLKFSVHWDFLCGLRLQIMRPQLRWG
jgi:hypothetical protein